MKTKQYTIRGISEHMDSVAREQAASYKSMNALLLDALKKGLGTGEEPIIFHDMDDLVGTWQEDKGFEDAVKAFESVDEDMWK